MNTSGEVADLMVKESIQVTESAVKLAGLGAKNLAAIIIALVNDDNKLQGKTNLKQLLKADKPLCILQIKEADLSKFNQEAKKYGVLFTAVSDKNNNTGLCDVIAKQEDVTKLNYIMERLGYAAPDIEQSSPEPEKAKPGKEEKETKNFNPRVKENQREKGFTKHGDMEAADRAIEKPSVKKRIEDIKAQRAKTGNVLEKQKDVKHINIKSVREKTKPKEKTR